MKPTMTRQQAIDRIQRYLEESITAFSPRTPTPGAPYGGDGACDDPDDDGPKGRISPYRDYLLSTFPKGADAAPLFDQILTYWTTHGFRLLHDERPTSQAITVENTTDGFRIGIQTGRDGTVSLSLSAPCIWPNGTPEPAG